MLKSIRNIQILIVLLICLGLFSTGFAAWNIADQVKNSVESTGSILVDSTEYISKYIHLDNTGSTNPIKISDFSSKGFVNNGVTNQTMIIKSYFVVDVKAIKADFPSFSSIDAEFILKYKNYDIDPTFDIFHAGKSAEDPNKDMVTIKQQLAWGVTKDSASSSSDLVNLTLGNSVSNEHNITSVLTDKIKATTTDLAHFELSFNIIVNSKSDYLTTVYLHLYNNGKIRSFVISAKLDIK